MHTPNTKQTCVPTPGIAHPAVHANPHEHTHSDPECPHLGSHTQQCTQTPMSTLTAILSARTWDRTPSSARKPP